VSPPAWLWQSVKPGTMVIPWASKVLVSFPIRFLMSALLPTAMNLLLVTANASARGRRSSTV
jgi:hypothetical protein